MSLVGLNLKDEETVALVTAVAERLGVSKTGAVRALAREKLAALDAERADRRAETLAYLQAEIWPHSTGVPLSKGEREQIVGYDDMLAG